MSQGPQPNRRGHRRLGTLYALLGAATLLTLLQPAPPEWAVGPIGLLLILFCGQAIRDRQVVVNALRAVHAPKLQGPITVVITALGGLLIGIIFSIIGLVDLIRTVSARLR